MEGGKAKLMACYVDDAYIRFGRMIMCHLIADSSRELHEMAQSVGVRRMFCQFEGTAKEHYDVSKLMRARAVERGAVEVTSRVVGHMIRQRVKAAEAAEKAE